METTKDMNTDMDVTEMGSNMNINSDRTDMDI